MKYTLRQGPHYAAARPWRHAGLRLPAAAPAGGATAQVPGRQDAPTTRTSAVPASPYPAVGPGTHFLSDDAPVGKCRSRAGTGPASRSWPCRTRPPVCLLLPLAGVEGTSARHPTRRRRYPDRIPARRRLRGAVRRHRRGRGPPHHGGPLGLRDQSYLNSDLQYWLNGPGQAAQGQDPYAKQWVDEYSNWIVKPWQRAMTTGDFSSLKSDPGSPPSSARYDSPRLPGG